MRRDQAQRLAGVIVADKPGLMEVKVERVPDGAPDPYGYVVYVDGVKVSSPADWSAMCGEDERPSTYNVTIRIPQELADRLKERADANLRSLNAEITLALRRHVEGES